MNGLPLLFSFHFSTSIQRMAVKELILFGLRDPFIFGLSMAFAMFLVGLCLILWRQTREDSFKIIFWSKNSSAIYLASLCDIVITVLTVLSLAMINVSSGELVHGL